jgi:ZIP family zinc transporter
MLAVAIHNIPEGISVSIPIFYSTGSKKKAFGYSFLSGLAEPGAALLGAVVLLPFLTPELIHSLLAIVAGIMIYLSLDEILPTAHLYNKGHLVGYGVVVGMLIMAISLILLYTPL